MWINFYADLRQLAGSKTVDVNVGAPMTARQALESVTRTRLGLAEKIWRAPGKPYEHIHVFINGRQSTFLPQGLDTPVQSGDTLDVFPPVGGGAKELAMTEVTLKFTGHVRARMKADRLDFAFEGTTLGDLLKALFAQCNLRDLVLDENDKIIPWSRVLVNGRFSEFLGDLRAPVQGGDEIVIIRPYVVAF